MIDSCKIWYNSTIINLKKKSNMRNEIYTEAYIGNFFSFINKDKNSKHKVIEYMMIKETD